MKLFLSKGRIALFALTWTLIGSAASGAALPEWAQAAVAAKDSPGGKQALESVIAKGGAAMELLHATEVRFTSTDQAQTRHRIVLWIGAEAGRQQAPTAQAYNPNTERVVSARAWTLSANGKHIRSFERRDFLDTIAHYDDYIWDQERAISFAATDKVELGGIVVCEIEIAAAPGVFGKTCNFQSSYYVLTERFDVVPAADTTLLWHASSARLAKPIAGALPGSLSWELDRIVPSPLGRPNGFIVNPLQVSVRCVSAVPGMPYARNWQEESSTVAAVMDPARDATAAIRAEAATLTAGKGERWARIRALTEFVQRQIVYLSVMIDKDNLAGYRPHQATKVLNDRFGDCKDKATLLVSLLRAEGEDAHLVLLYAGNPSVVAADWPALVFNHAIVAIPAGGSVPAGWPAVNTARLGAEVLFDPTDPVIPLGVLSPGDQGGYGLIVDATAGELDKLPPADLTATHLNRTVHVTFRGGGIVEADVDEDRHGLSGAEEYRTRFARGTKRFTNALETRIHRATPTAENLHWTENWDPASAHYQLDFHFQTGPLIRPIGDDSEMITPQLLPVGSSLVAWTSRTEGTVWLPPEAISEETILPVPAGYRVDELPDAWAQTSARADCHVSYRTEGSSVIYRTEVSRPAGFFDKSQYENLRTFYQKLHEAQRRPIVFRRVLPT